MDSGSHFWLLSRGMGFFIEGNVLTLRHWLLAYVPNLCLHGQQCGCEMRRYGRFGGRVTCTANVIIRPMGPILLDNEEESGTI